MRRFEGAVVHAQFFADHVHFLDESRLRSVDMLGNRATGVVARSHGHAVQQAFERQLVPGTQSHA